MSGRYEVAATRSRANSSDTAAAMGVNSPSIYAAFGCKEELFREAVVLYSATEGRRIWEAMTTAPSARAAIETMLRVSAEDFTRPSKPRGCLVVLGAIHADDGKEAVHRELRENRAQNIELLWRRLEHGVVEAELPEGVNCRAVATFYATVQHGMSIQARDGASRKTLLAVADCAMAAWDGLVSRGGNAGTS